MAEIINLNRYRKGRRRAEQSSQAEANRAKFGLTRTQRAAAREQAEKQARELEGKRLDDETRR